MSEQVYTDIQAQKVVRDYCCAGCWGHLVTEFADDREMRLVVCPGCGDGRGFVTRQFAERQQAESRIDAFDARRNLQAVMPGLKPAQQAEAEILKGLGF